MEPSESTGTAPAEGEEEDRLLLRHPVRETWTRGFATAVRFQREFGHVRVPLNYREPDTDHPTGRWNSGQPTQYAAGRTDEGEGREQRRRLDEIGTVWSAPDLAWEEKTLAAARSYFAEHGTLCAPAGRGAVADESEAAGWLGKDPIKAAQRCAELEEIDSCDPKFPILDPKSFAGKVKRLMSVWEVRLEFDSVAVHCAPSCSRSR